MTINAYSHVYALTHAANAHLWDGHEVVIEEKLDGSQFSFGVFVTSGGDQLFARSRKQRVELEAPPKLFLEAVQSIQDRQDLLTPGFTYRCEYLRIPKHNTLAYKRVPNGFLMLLDVDLGQQLYANPHDKAAEAARIGLECVPYFDTRLVPPTLQELDALMQRPSILGGPIEGLVFKNYTNFGVDGKVCMGKYVSDSFKERNGAKWKGRRGDNRKDLLEFLAQSVGTEARWRKVVQHLREEGRLVNAPQDIGLLYKELQEDVLREEASALKEALLAWAWPHLNKRIGRGLAEWYKQQLG